MDSARSRWTARPVASFWNTETRGTSRQSRWKKKHCNDICSRKIFLEPQGYFGRPKKMIAFRSRIKIIRRTRRLNLKFKIKASKFFEEVCNDAKWKSSAWKSYNEKEDKVSKYYDRYRRACSGEHSNVLRNMFRKQQPEPFSKRREIEATNVKNPPVKISAKQKHIQETFPWPVSRAIYDMPARGDVSPRSSRSPVKKPSDNEAGARRPLGRASTRGRP